MGTRNATRLGCDTAGALALELARAGVAVVSGLALGIDGAAHAGVVAELERSSSTPHGVGRPVAVVAAGLDRRYPRAHASLHDRIARTGAVVSEVPLGVAPSRWRFPARNRIIAGLADALVVVESRSAGGSMLTVGDALARDVPVLAVPGHPTSPAAAGTLDLICDGATPVRDAQDVLVAIGRGGLGPDGGGAQRSGGGRSTIDGVTWGEEVLGELASGPRTFTELTAKIDAPMDDLAEALLRLEVLGLLTRTGTWYQEAVASPARAGARSR